MSSQDYFRPRGDITTVLDLVNRDAQDNTYFPIDSNFSWFHATPDSSSKEIGIAPHTQTVYPTALSIQEFPQRGPADWGQKFSFEIGSLNAGDLLQSVILQMKVDSWYDKSTLRSLLTANLNTDLTRFANQYWTYINSLGTAVIEYADFVVNDQTIERITGEFIKTVLSLDADQNHQFGISADGIGSIPHSHLNPSTVQQTAFRPSRPYPTEDGIFFCILPFFFFEPN